MRDTWIENVGSRSHVKVRSSIVGVSTGLHLYTTLDCKCKILMA